MKSSVIRNNDVIPKLTPLAPLTSFRKVVIVALEIIFGAALIAGGLYLSHFYSLGTIGYASIGSGGGVLLLGIVLTTILCMRRKGAQQENSRVTSNPTTETSRSSPNQDPKNSEEPPPSGSTTSVNPTSPTTLNNGTITQPHIRATVYVVNKRTGEIFDDKEHEFSKHLKDENKNPIIPAKDDIYLEIEGVTSDGKQFSELLPSTLFHGVREGWNEYKQGIHLTPFAEVFEESEYAKFLKGKLFRKEKDEPRIRFYKDDQLIELTCKQSTTNDFRTRLCPFEEVIYYIKLYNGISGIPAMFGKDIEREPRFMGCPRGDKIERLEYGEKGWRVSSQPNFDEYFEDQVKHGTYKPLTILKIVPSGILFDLSRGSDDETPLPPPFRTIYKPKPSDLHFYHTKALGGVNQLWIFVKHRPEANRIPPEHKMFKTNTQGVMEIVPFNPDAGDRLNTYHYGQYAMIPLPCPIEDVHVGFNPNDDLQLVFKDQQNPGLLKMQSENWQALAQIGKVWDRNFRGIFYKELHRIVNGEFQDARDFSFYELDQKKHGNYQPIKQLEVSNDKIVFDISQEQLTIDDIHEYESNGSDTWIFIPHKLGVLTGQFIVIPNSGMLKFNDQGKLQLSFSQPLSDKMLIELKAQLDAFPQRSSLGFNPV